MIELTLDSGNKAYVGKNARDNEELVHFFNQDGYIWFHADEYPGPHVIMYNPTPSDKKEAAQIAIDRSKAPFGKNNVIYCAVCELYKERKSTIGEFCTPDNARLYKVHK